MTKKSDNFEKQIYRIHQLLEDTGSEITWNDKIPDPDNPEQNRQIDVSIKNGDKLTLVECRIHQDPQDVKWIEELIGRKLSLQADTIIAVSNSGFTKGAIKKAESFAIILRDLYTLSDEEIKGWAKTEILIGLYEYKNISIDIFFPISMKGKINEEETFQYINDILFQKFMDNFRQKLNEISFSGRNQFFQLRFDFEPNFYKINKTYIVSALFRSFISLRSEKYYATYIVLYDDVNKKGVNKETSVEKFGPGNSEVIKSIGNATIRFDLTSFKIPDNCQFNGIVHFDMRKSYKLNAIPYSIGSSLSLFTNSTFRIGYCEPEN